MMKKKCVFVLEDNDDLRELFTYLLEEESYQVSAYPTAQAFWESLANCQMPDMILLDVMLPDGNGLEICCRLKHNPITQNIPIMMMSAHAEIAEMKEKCEAEEFISKPFDIVNFTDKIHKHINLILPMLMLQALQSNLTDWQLLNFNIH